MMIVVDRSWRVVPAMVVQAFLRHQSVVLATMVVRTWSVCQQVTAHRRRHLCMMVMVMTMVMVVMRARSISIVVVVKARRVMVLAVVCCGRRNQKQCQQHCHWNIHGIHGDTLTREAGNHRLPLS
jgi:hypothetical protein